MKGIILQPIRTNRHSFVSFFHFISCNDSWCLVSLLIWFDFPSFSYRIDASRLGGALVSSVTCFPTVHSYSHACAFYPM